MSVAKEIFINGAGIVCALHRTVSGEAQEICVEAVEIVSVG